MSQRRKSLRLAGKERKGENPGSAKSGSLSSGVVSRSIETLVFETVIPLFKDVELLKLCRLVSKEWNSLACPPLRAISKTFLHNPALPDDFGFNSLKYLVENRNSGLPSAFQNFHILVMPFPNEPFWCFVEYITQQEDLFLSGLTLDMWDQTQSTNERIASFLLSNRKNEKLVQMKIYGSAISNLCVFPYDQIWFPHLKEIEVITYALNPELDMFLENILLHSPLVTIRLLFFETPGIQWKFGSGSFGDVTKLCIKCDWAALLPEDWDHLSRVRMPKVRELVFKDVRRARDQAGHAHLLAAMLSNAAGTVKSLRGDVIPFEMLSTFPKLREICPHFGVERIELCVKRYGGGGGNDPEIVHYQNLLERALRCSTTQFPNVVELKLESRFNRLTSSLLATVHACFPRLKVLELCGMKGDFGALSGYEVNVESWLELGIPMEKAPRRCSLQSFDNLEKVILGEEISVSENLVKNCLSKVVKLMYLEFEWKEGLSPETIRDYLRSVQLIRISKCSFFKKKTLEEKDRILAMLPGVFIDHE